MLVMTLRRTLISPPQQTGRSRPSLLAQDWRRGSFTVVQETGISVLLLAHPQLQTLLRGESQVVCQYLLISLGVPLKRA